MGVVKRFLVIMWKKEAGFTWEGSWDSQLIWSGEEGGCDSHLVCESNQVCYLMRDNCIPFLLSYTHALLQFPCSLIS